MGSNAHEAYERPCYIYVNHEQSISNMLDLGMAVFLHKIFVYLCVVKEHSTLLKKVLVCLHQYMFYCKLKKCSFLCNSAMLLSFDFTPKGMQLVTQRYRA